MKLNRFVQCKGDKIRTRFDAMDDDENVFTKISLDVSHFPCETFTQIYFYKHFWVNARTFGVKSTFQLDGRTVSAFKRSLGIKNI